MASQTSNQCLVCNNTTTTRCERCKSTHYCSRKCQETDWNIHKLLCRAFSAFDTTSRPTNKHIKAILFPVDSTKPEVIWIHAPLRGGGLFEGEPYQAAEIGPLLGTDAMPWEKSVQSNKVLKRKLRDTVRVCFRETFLVDGSLRNKGIARICATIPGRQHHDWRGPVVLYGMVGLGSDQVQCRDLDMSDFRHAAGFFITYDSTPIAVPPQPFSARVLGVRINCKGDQQLCHRPEFEEIEISHDHPIFSQHGTSDIAHRVGLPVFTRRCDPEPMWSNGGFNHSNQHASMLHLTLDPDSKFNTATDTMSFGWAPMRWSMSVGSFLIVRQDKKPLSTFDAEALSTYCYHEILPLFAHYNGEYAEVSPMTSDDILARISRSTFTAKWEKMRDDKRKAEDFTEFPDPYSL